MSFETNGFLSSQIDEFRQRFIEDYQALFEFVKELNHFAIKIKDKFSIHNQDSRELIIGALYIKVLQSFESTIILSERGLESDSKSILRVMIEAAFYLKAACIDESFCDDYIKSDDLERFKFLNRVRRDKKGIFSCELREYASKDRIESLKNSAWGKKDNPFEIYKVAQRANMYDFYQLVYGLLSSDVHTSIRSLDRFYVVNNEGLVEYLIFAPQYDKWSIAILTACSILNIVLSCTCLFCL